MKIPLAEMPAEIAVCPMGDVVRIVGYTKDLRDFTGHFDFERQDLPKLISLLQHVEANLTDAHLDNTPSARSGAESTQ
jgi:hypothetical protein